MQFCVPVAICTWIFLGSCCLAQKVTTSKYSSRQIWSHHNLCGRQPRGALWWSYWRYRQPNSISLAWLCREIVWMKLMKCISGRYTITADAFMLNVQSLEIGKTMKDSHSYACGDFPFEKIFDLKQNDWQVDKCLSSNVICSEVIDITMILCSNGSEVWSVPFEFIGFRFRIIHGRECKLKAGHVAKEHRRTSARWWSYRNLALWQGLCLLPELLMLQHV